MPRILNKTTLFALLIFCAAAGYSRSATFNHAGKSASASSLSSTTNLHSSSQANVYSPADGDEGVKVVITTYRDDQVYETTADAGSLRTSAAPVSPNASGNDQPAAAGDIVISQIYSSGGNAGSTYQNNYLELFNRTSNAIDFDGWRIYFTSANGTFDQAVSFTSSRQIFIGAHQYLLISWGPTSANGAPVPADLFVPFITPPPPIPPPNISPSGKVFLTMPNVQVFGSSCPLPNSQIVDFVGYGSTANCFEGTGPTATTNNTTAAVRKNGGCTDTDNNGNDFSVVAPNPRNSQTAANNCSNPIDDADFFVRQHYSDFLNRQPDASGLAFWKDQITSCGANQACIELKRINVSAAFFISIEFQQTGYLVYRTYKAGYGNMPNAPVPLKLDEFLPDMQLIGQGVVVNAPGWEQVLDVNKNAFFLDFVSRLRFRNDYPTTLSPAQFVDLLFSRAAVMPAANERADAINEFGAASDTGNTDARRRALRRIAENPTLAALESNRAFVLMQYFGYLRRNPNDPPEPGLNFDGYNFWLTKLNQFNGNFVNADMVKAFLVSSEYRQRFGP